MFRAIQNFIRYRVARKIGIRAASALGLGSMAGIIGVIAGVRAMRRG